MSRRTRTTARTFTAGLLTVALLGTGQFAASAVEPSGDITFATQQGGTYSGLPLFDGVPSHLDEYLDTLMDYSGLAAAVNWANGRRGDFTIPSGPNAGHVVPGAAQWGEGVQGISTDFPAITSQGQTWNTALVTDIGNVVGDEKLYTQSWSNSLSAYNATLAAAMQDLRPNPLSGRLDESYGEDEELSSDFVKAFATGASGVADPANDNGFWSKAVVVTKHYTDYAAQWYRVPGSTDASQRALMEYWAQPPLDGLESGSISGMITSYGRTNGVPNSISPLIEHAESLSPWGSVYTTPDNGSENRLHAVNAYSNGFDNSYTPTWGDATALMTIAGQGAIAATGGSTDRNSELLARIDNGTYGVDAEQVYDLAKMMVAPLVRVGIFNERDENGLPKYYPWANRSSASSTVLNYTNTEHQDVALQAAQQSVVLLKNQDGVLPLDKGDSLAVAGPMSDARFRTTYATSTPSLPNSGLTPVEGIEALSTGDVTSSSDGNVVRLQSVATGKYLTLGAEASPSLGASTTDGDLAATFESFDWGQGAVGLRSTDTGKWVQFASNAVNVGQTFNLNGRGNGSGWGAATMPHQIRPVDNGDGTVSFVVASFGGGFGGGFETAYYTTGRYLTVDPGTGQVGVTGVLANKANARSLLTDAAKFKVETVREAGSQTVTAGKDYAVVVVGQPARNSQGEGSDRSTLALADDQYELVDTVANAYPGRTIVVLSTSSPVLVDEIQNNDKVAAIVEAPDGGQYGNYALAQVLFGDYAPTGRLTQTWYASMDALPAISSYSIPQGPDATTTLEGLDPRFTVDMTNADPAEANLTYKYTDAATTYPFGYGLSFSTFTHKNLHVEKNGESFTATVDVTNTGSVDTDEVVQLYATNPDSAYGAAAPSKQLAAFKKVHVPAGETKSVTLTFDAEALALWDVNSNADVVEPGTYTFAAGSSSADADATATLTISGNGVATLNAVAKPVNVFDHSFDSSQVFYREASKQNTVNGLNDDALVNGYYVVGSRAAGAWTAIKGLNLKNAKAITLSLGSTNPNPATVELRLDSPTGTKIAEYDVTSTGASQYVIAASKNTAGDIPVKELAYTPVSADLAGPVSGVHDVYVVFGANDLRVKDLQVTLEPVVTDALTAAIAAANALQSADYTASSFQGLQQALTAAEAVAAEATATQSEIDAATAALTQAQGALARAVKSVIASTSKTTYKVGQAFEPGTVAVTAALSDGTLKKLNSDQYTLSGFDSSQVGVTTVTASVKPALLAAGSAPVTSDVLLTVTSGVGPKVSVSSPKVPASGWFRGPVPVTVTVSDPHAKVYVAVDNNAAAPYTGTVTLTGNGIHRVQAFAVGAGEVYSSVADLTVKIDAAAPVVTVKSAENARLTLAASDAHSGVAKVQYSLNGGKTWATYGGPVNVAGAPKSVSYRATDKAGNVSTTKSVTVKGKLSLSTPVVSGTAVVGKKLTAKVSKATSGAKLSYQWLRNGKAISAATKASYTLKSADRGARVSVKVTATKANFTTVTKTSKSSAKVKATLTLSKPVIKGTPTVGRTLTASVASKTSGATLKYQWYRSGKAISGATKSTYKVTSPDRGKTLTVKVTASKTDHLTTSKTSSGVRAR